MTTRIQNSSSIKSAVKPAVTLVAIVDDDLHERQSLSRGVSLYGFRCIIYETQAVAFHALTASKNDGVDLVIVDVSHDVAKGLGFIEELRRLRADLPIIVLRGLEWDARIKDLADSGVTILPRPFTANNLVSEIEDLLKQEE